MTVDNHHSVVVIFDGVWNLCNGAVNFIIKRDPDARFLFIPSQSDLAGQLAAVSTTSRNRLMKRLC